MSRSEGIRSARPAIGLVRSLVVTNMIDREPSDTAPPPPSILWNLGLLHGELRARHGLALHDHLVLAVLAEAEAEAGGGPVPVPVARLTAVLGESGSRMTFLLKGLQAAGLIERDRRAGDRRTVEVTLTDAGRARSAAAERTAHARLSRRPGA
ncbi:MarR family winged helix-turn-helix transcriptional regulator [Streptomyces sp. NPDC090075]|uniref:MarR family winged helix-turn-helix transcriptional regulator n=1 Tax=Streptomyces sp. NPDC090075 TaxID=3365937 RepID=UPI0037F78684